MRAVTSASAFYSPLAAEVGGSLNWVFFAAGPVLAGFETATSAPVVADLWRLAAEEDATIESVVASIPTRGPDAVDTFAVVVLGDPVTVVLRGDARVDIETVQGQRRIDSRGMQPWYLAEFTGTLGGSLGAAERPLGAVTEPATSDLPMLSGLVRAPWLAWSSASQDAVAPRRDTAAGPFRPRGGGTAAGEARASRPITGSTPVQKLAAAPGAQAAPITTPIPVIPALPPDLASGAGGAAGAAEPPEPGDTVSPAGTGRWSLLAPAERVGELASAVESGGDIGDTIVTSRQRHRAHVPVLAAWSPGRLELDPRFRTGQTPAAQYHGFRVGDGSAYRLDTPVYIGRKPRSPRIVTGTVPRLLKVPSPSREISGTHIELRQEGERVVVTDMRSTNGTFVAQPGHTHVKLRQGESLVVAPGTRIDIGDGVVIEVLPIPAPPTR